MNSDLPVLGFLGGTGPHGRGLGLRLGRAGHRVLIGSRDAARAQEVATALSERVADGKFEGLDNAGVCEAADVLLVTVPNDSVVGLLAGLSDAIGAKVVISCVNSLAFDERGPTVARAPAGSWAEECQRLLPDGRVASAFQNVSSAKLRAGEGPVRADVLVCGDDLGAKEIAMELARHIPGLRPIDIGALRLAGPVEDLTPVLLSINKRHKIEAGLEITGLDDQEGAG